MILSAKSLADRRAVPGFIARCPYSPRPDSVQKAWTTRSDVLHALLFPLDRKAAREWLQLKQWRLAAVENGFHNVGRKQSEPQHVRHKRAVQILGRSKLSDSGKATALQHDFPSKRAGERHDQGAVGPRLWR